MKIWLDLETYSPTPITNGLHRYAEDVEILIRALALDDRQVIIRDLTPGGRDWLLDGDQLQPAPRPYVEEIDAAIRKGDGEVWAQNSQFDRTVERWAGLGIPLHRWRDTMVQALAHSLPGALGDLCEVLKLPTDKAKDKAGKALIQLFCKPIPFKFRKRAEGEKLADYKAARDAAEKSWNGRATRDTHPAEWHQFLLYAGRDIEAMRAAHKIMPTWNYRGAELDLWHLDQTINDRGVAIDVELAECAVNAVDEAQATLRERTAEITNGEVESATKRDAMLAHVLAEYGVELPDMQMATLERRIADPDLPEGLRELLKIRLQASTTSTSKYKTLIKGTSTDGRLRGLLQFCGAARTGRWAGRLWQPQNLPRPVLKQDEIDAGIDALKAGMANVLYDNVMQLTSSAIRGCIIAPPGKKLVVADLSNIEGRVLAWLAGERWKITAFHDFDTLQALDGLDTYWVTGPTYVHACKSGTLVTLARDKKGEPIHKGHDLYKLSYGKSFSVAPEDVTKDQRQVGKVQELALGYEGGVGAFVTFAAAYNIDLEKLAEIGSRAIPGEVWGRANIMYEWHQKQGRHPDAALGLSKKAWLTCESFKLGWRDAHQNVVQLWRDLDAAVRSAITRPGETFIVGVLRVRRDGAWLRIVLPSGRALCYPSPALVPEKKKRKLAEWEVDEQDVHGEDTGRTVITYMGVNQYSRKWDRIQTYGGKLVENCVAENTSVLTEFGWRSIQFVEDWMLVWDGVEWVKHDGCVYKGKQVVFSTYGVQMTPDHRVLTVEGWKNASSCEGLDRAEVGLPNGYQVRGVGERSAVDVGSEMRVRQDETHAGVGVHEAAEAGNCGVMRVYAASDDRPAEHHARHESPPGVRGVAQHDQPVPLADAPGVSQLWRAGHRGVRALARIVRKLLGGYGAGVPDRADAGAAPEQRGVRAGELRVADDAPAGEQQTQLADHRNALGPDDDIAGGTAVRDIRGHIVLAPGSRVERREGACAAVYDLVNCGPRNRFVVRGADGLPLIVHNCTQAVARDVMAANMPAIEAEMYEIVLTVHDEIICEAPEHEDWSHEHLAALMATVPPWAAGLPLAAAGFEATRYRKD